MGCLYGMSFNLVRQFAVIAEARTETLRGGEDKVSTRIAAKIVAATNTSCNWVNDEFIHDHPDCGCGPNAVPFSNATVAVHQLKAYSLWNSTLSHFFGSQASGVILTGVVARDFPGLHYKTCNRIVD